VSQAKLIALHQPGNENMAITLESIRLGEKEVQIENMMINDARTLGEMGYVWP
jgi:hypothetical protein